MASTKIDICSQALLLLGANSISSFDDGTNEADACALLYPSFVRRILSMHPWTFAVKKKQLLRDPETPTNEFKYAYRLPPEAISLNAVFDSTSQGATPVTEGWDVMHHNDSTMILTDLEKVVAEVYIYVNEALWPGFFEYFAVRAFAAELALPVTDNGSLASEWRGIAYGSAGERGKGGLFASAATDDSQQAPNEILNTGPLIAARFG